MSSVVDSARVLRHAAVVAVEDMKAIYTWKTWTFGWMARMVVQIIFYAVIGLLLESDAQVEYLLIGNVVWVATSTVMLSVASTAWERYTGTLPLLVAAPSTMIPTFIGRSVQWIPDGLATAFVALAIAAPLFDISLPFPAALWTVPIVLLTLVATYGIGTFLGGIVLRFMEARNVVSNSAMGIMAIVCGVNVPVDFFPTWVEGVSRAFPLTYGLEAVRDVLAGAGAGRVLPNVGWCALVGAVWLIAAALVFDRFGERGRADGSIEFG